MHPPVEEKNTKDEDFLNIETNYKKSDRYGKIKIDISDKNILVKIGADFYFKPDIIDSKRLKNITEKVREKVNEKKVEKIEEKQISKLP